VIRLLLVDDHASFRELLALRLEREPDIAVVGEAGSLAAARMVLRDLSDGIDVALVDLDLPDGSGTELIRELRRENSEVLVVVLTASGDRRRHAAAIASGAAGVLQKEVSSAAIIEAIRHVSAGEPILTPREAIELLRIGDQERELERATSSTLGRLTPREREILQLLAEGLGDQAIAERLYVSPKTIRNQMVGILGKLGVDSRLQALVLAVRHGVVQIT
jgi:DNA-binding NarL/FixJ family response regulator